MKMRLPVLQSKKNRIILKLKKFPQEKQQSKSLLNGLLVQDNDEGNFSEWKEAGGRNSTGEEKEDLIFGNLVCKHLKSNAIAIVKNKQLLGKGLRANFAHRCVETGDCKSQSI